MRQLVGQRKALLGARIVAVEKHDSGAGARATRQACSSRSSASRAHRTP
jgi:hypothetical protein